MLLFDEIQNEENDFYQKNYKYKISLIKMVYPDRQRQRQKGRYNRNHSPSNEDEHYRRRSRSRSDQKDRRRSRDHRQHKQKTHNSHSRSPSDHYDKYERSHSKKRDEQSENDQGYQQREQEQLEQKIRLGLRNNDLHFNKKLQEAYAYLPQRKQEELAMQARSPSKIHEIILVRELFISGLNDINEYTITELMGKYGEIENIEIIKDFAFVKYYRVEDASNACADYHNINASVQPLINSNFKIFFADHLKRWNVVSNHPDYEITQYLAPVVYVSLKNDPYHANQKYLYSVFKKYGFIRNLELRKNQFPGPKIHVNVEYETIDMAIRARDKLKNLKEKVFGQKKAELCILIDTEKFVRAFPNVSNQIRYQKKRLQNLNPSMNMNLNSGMPNINSYNNLNAMDTYPPSMSSMNPLMNPQMQIQNPLGSQAPSISSSYQTEDIFAMLQKLNQKKQESQMEAEVEQDADWVGFFTRNNQFKVEVEFNRIHKEVPFNLQIILNVSHRGDIYEALNRTDYVLAGKFKAVNKLNQEAFNEYIKYFVKKNRGGIIFSNDYLIYLLPPKDDLNLPYKVNHNELLALFFKIKN